MISVLNIYYCNIENTLKSDYLYDNNADPIY